ncbi:hypothetical protein KIN20_031933 [Parelaphostrongylus tenuis]|uniref:Lipoprotein n=1 Tax=Parelaphostrongylus tenuis TaxID=148309 RepID=A0AAD5R5S4_PARTN|nr:hypothetical protein KIN20_031933 [Parelaphostrongylus tenuis]
MAKLRIIFHLILQIVTVSTVFGCGVMPAGQMSTRSLNVAGFTLPVPMVYSGAAEVEARVPGMATSEAAARGFVERLIMQANCLIVSNTVTAICLKKGAMMCDTSKTDEIAVIPAKHLSISGTLSTTNFIMANWSRSMWQNVMNRAFRMLASGPFGSHFISASATVHGN